MNLENPTTSPPILTNSLLAAAEKFCELNDDLSAVQATVRRVFFGYLRTKPTLSTEEIDTLWTISELLADITKAKN